MNNYTLTKESYVETLQDTELLVKGRNALKETGYPKVEENCSTLTKGSCVETLQDTELLRAEMHESKQET